MPELSEYSRKWRPVSHVWPIVAAACLGLAVAVSAWFAVSIWEERLARAKFTAVAGDYAATLQNGLNDYLGKIVALRAFYDSSVEVDSDEFSLFTSQINRQHGDVMRLIWCPRVTRDQRAEFERKQRDGGLTDCTIKTWAMTNPMSVSPERDEYFPIPYSTVASQKSAIKRARAGNIMATAQNIQEPATGPRLTSSAA
jgi:CHASE1-domain containing sensor protein